jgi:hypothetical protein
MATVPRSEQLHKPLGCRPLLRKAERRTVHGVSAAQEDPVRIGRQSGSQNGSQNGTQNGRVIQAASFSEPCLSGLPPTRGVRLAARLPKPLPCRPPKEIVETGAVHGLSSPEEVAIRIATQNATGSATRTATQNGRAI